MKQTCTFHSFLIAFCGPGFVDLHWSLPITSLWNNIPDGRETGTRRNVILDITLPCQAIPAQEGSSVGEADPRTHVAKLSADYTEENKYSLFLEHFSPKWTKPVLPKSQSIPKMLQIPSRCCSGSWVLSQCQGPSTDLLSLSYHWRGLEVWRLKVLPLIQQGSQSEVKNVSPLGIQQHH